MRAAIKIAYLILLMLGAVVQAAAQNSYPLIVQFVDKDTSLQPQALGISTSFRNRDECYTYVTNIQTILRNKGFYNASVDSLAFDSSYARAWIYVGSGKQILQLAVTDADREVLLEIGWKPDINREKLWNPDRVAVWKERLLAWFENNGYPFASVRLEQIAWAGDTIHASLQIDRGPLYKIDSISVNGKARIKNHFLQKYLDIKAGSVYRKSKLDMISSRLIELPYLKETRKWDMTMLGTGSTLNLYLDPKKSSQINVLVGFLPDNSQVNGKLLLTGEADVHLQNALGAGETILANWQQVQVKSPRLKLAYQQPYIFKTSFGLDFSFDLFKKDSSFINIDFTIGLQYIVSARETGKIFYRNLTTNLLTIDTNLIRQTHSLPQYLDVNTSNLGVEYQRITTDYRYNPTRGNEVTILLSGGLRRIKKNPNITELGKGPTGDGFDYASLYDTLPEKTYILTSKISAAQYIKLGKQSTLKTAFQGGWIKTENPFKNEIFQIGGYRILRGFDEQSIYATLYTVGTLEYRYRIGLNSFLFGFTDIAYANNDSYTEKMKHGYLGFGMGITFETKAGLFNLTYAVGKRNDLPLNFRQSKIHFGFISLF